MVQFDKQVYWILQVTAIEKNGAGNSNLSIKVLLDFTRGSRGSDNSRTMLVPLIKNCYDCQVLARFQNCSFSIS